MAMQDRVGSLSQTENEHESQDRTALKVISGVESALVPGWA